MLIKTGIDSAPLMKPVKNTKIKIDYNHKIIGKNRKKGKLPQALVKNFPLTRSKANIFKESTKKKTIDLMSITLMVWLFFIYQTKTHIYNHPNPNHRPM